MTAKNPTWQTSRNTDRQQKNPNKRAREKRWQENNLPFATELFSNTAQWKKQSALNRKKTICLQ